MQLVKNLYKLNNMLGSSWKNTLIYIYKPETCNHTFSRKIKFSREITEFRHLGPTNFWDFPRTHLSYNFPSSEKVMNLPMWALSGTRSAHWGKHHSNFQSSNLRVQQEPFLLKEFTAMHWRRFKRHTNKSWHDGFCSLPGSGSVRFGISDLSPMQGKTFIKWGLNFTESLSSSTYRWKGCSCITARKCRSGCGAQREKGENSHWPFCCLKDWMEPEWWTIFTLRVPVELRSCPRGMW